MYAYLDGRLAYKSATYVIIDVNGVGYQVLISLHTFSNLPEGERCKLYTWLHVKEDGHTLYGFSEEGERRLFLHLISVSGIGPNTARMILSSASPADSQQAIIRGDVPLIQRIKGIGGKTAQRLVLELQDKLKKDGPDSLITAPQAASAKDEAITALTLLGFTKPAVEKVINEILTQHPGSLTVEQLIKFALKRL